MKLSHCYCLYGLRFSLVFKTHIVPDLLPIAGSELIMQLLLIKQRCYIFISIRLLIPHLFFFLKKRLFHQGNAGRCQVGWCWRCISLALAELAPLMFLLLGSPMLTWPQGPCPPPPFLLPGSAKVKGGIPKVVAGSPKHCHHGEMGAVRDGRALNSGRWVGGNGSVLFSILYRKFHILCKSKSKVWKIWV